MLKGIAHTHDDDPSDNRQGVVVALSRLSRDIANADSCPFNVAAEAAATLLRLTRVAVFLCSGGSLVLAGETGLDNDEALISGAEEIANAALMTSGPVLYPTVSSEPSAFARKFARSGVESIMCVPMRVGESNVGAIVAMSELLRTFSPSDIELLHVVASQAALAAVQTEITSDVTATPHEDDLIRLAQRKIQELSLINQVSEAISSTLDLDRLLKIALEQSMAAVGADVGSIMLINEDTNKLEIVASRGLAQRWIDSTHQAIGDSVAGWVAEHGESVLVSDARKDSRFRMSVFRDDISSAASVPLKSKGGVIGVLNVNTLDPSRAFDERDLELLATVANQMAVAIDNARLYARVNRRTKQLDSLLHISRTVTSTLNFDEVMHRLCDELLRLYQMDVAAILLLDELSERLRFGHGHGLRSTRRKYFYYDLVAPLAARVKATGRKLVVRDVLASRLYRTDAAVAEGIRTAICIPLKNQGKLIGVAFVMSRQVRTVPKSLLSLITRIGELSGVAIHNARVHRSKYRIAEILQRNLIPSSAPEIEGLEIGHKFLPAREVGGDYYDFIRLGSRSIGVVVGDVAGSDVEAAEYTTMGKHVLRTYAREFHSPAEVLRRTNDVVCEDTRAEMFISLCYGVIDLDRMALTYACAGCEPSILYKKATGETSTLRADGMLLGIKPGVVYQEREVALGRGDVLVMYTDGLSEAGVEGKRFGGKAISRVIAVNSELSAQGVADALYEALLEFVHGRVSDDVAVVVAKLV